ncbi:YhgE/Pip domain-containing protein [Rossellomorea sp. YZS02]|uniref:YhgE/Pip domain-containing protein n=1 Tax=Rossellomorea sp. YZS02 TaxID=3097358 RepID=UPI002A0C0707|nr:YhgE/Pip domain-containing protein [Rossellomorea sp. YZS02]MDX8343506.1 YhgE/Pip domain-containing protein [Rossellomorea sp. YZS02]
MKNIWRIFSRDMINVSRNGVAAFLIGGLMLLPSLYAWFNIEASWDPYSKTDKLPVGIVNEDNGAKIREQEINIGKDLVKELRKNDDMNWQFVDKKKAMDRVEYGDYFAVIIIPEDFSSKLATVIEDQPEKAGLEYYVNEKINAIAPKITESGAGGIVDKITSSFISTVNGTIFELFNELGIEIEKDLPDIKRFEEYVFKIDEKLPEIGDVLNESLADAKSAQGIIDEAQRGIPDAKRLTNQGLDTIDQTTAFLKKAEDRLNKVAPGIQKDLENVQDMAAKVNDFVQQIQSSEIDLSGAETINNQIKERLSTSIQTIDTIESSLKFLQNNEENQNQEQIKQALIKLDMVKQEIQTVQQEGQKLNAFLTTKQHDVDNVITSIKERAVKTKSEIDAFINEYKQTIEPAVLDEVASAKGTLNEARRILQDIQSTIPKVQRILSNTEGNIDKGTETLQRVMQQYPYVKEKISQLADRIRDIQGKTDINEIISLLQNDPTLEKSFFEEPVVLNKNSLFPIENYGAAMTPFYTVLAIWVGALLLISLLATEVLGEHEFSEPQIYFGKLLTFLSIGLIQAMVVTVGDIYVLGVHIAEPIWFILFGLFISFIFMIVVYTLVSVFGNVGKAMAIVLLVLQIAGAGGTYPVALLPTFFQTIHPFLPFSYAIDLMREAVGGIIWERAYRDILILGLFGVLAILFGAFLKGPLSKRTKAFMRKSKESGLFH